MKLKMSRAGSVGVQKAGELIEVSEGEGRRMIEYGQCRAATDVEVATFEAQRKAEAAAAAKVAEAAETGSTDPHGESANGADGEAAKPKKEKPAKK